MGVPHEPVQLVRAEGDDPALRAAAVIGLARRPALLARMLRR